MKNLITKFEQQKIIARVKLIGGNEKALWGKMNVHQMVCHCADQLKMGMGKIEIDEPGLNPNSFLKWLVLMGMPTPKGKVETFKKLKQGEGGTKPTELEKDKNELINLIDNYHSCFANNETRLHPAFGYMDYKQWGRISYRHLDYHLKQFGK